MPWRRLGKHHGRADQARWHVIHNDVQVDKGRVAARAPGAIALAIASPVLALIPLIDAGPGKDRGCRQLVREARTLPHTAKNKKAGPGHEHEPGA